jgi:hypothetical protein
MDSFQKREIFSFLYQLQDSGMLDVDSLGPWFLELQYNITKDEARMLVKEWIHTGEELCDRIYSKKQKMQECILH